MLIEYLQIINFLSPKIGRRRSIKYQAAQESSIERLETSKDARATKLRYLTSSPQELCINDQAFVQPATALLILEQQQIMHIGRQLGSNSHNLVFDHVFCMRFNSLPL